MTGKSSVNFRRQFFTFLTRNRPSSKNFFFPGKRTHFFERTTTTRRQQQQQQQHQVCDRRSARRIRVTTGKKARHRRARTQTRKRNVDAAIPRREPTRAGKRRVSVGPFRRVHFVQGEVFGVFAGAAKISFSTLSLSFTFLGPRFLSLTMSSSPSFSRPFRRARANRGKKQTRTGVN